MPKSKMNSHRGENERKGNTETGEKQKSGEKKSNKPSPQAHKHSPPEEKKCATGGAPTESKKIRSQVLPRNKGETGASQHQ